MTHRQIAVDIGNATATRCRECKQVDWWNYKECTAYHKEREMINEKNYPLGDYDFYRLDACRQAEIKEKAK